MAGGRSFGPDDALRPSTAITPFEGMRSLYYGDWNAISLFSSVHLREVSRNRLGKATPPVWRRSRLGASWRRSQAGGNFVQTAFSQLRCATAGARVNFLHPDLCPPDGHTIECVASGSCEEADSTAGVCCRIRRSPPNAHAFHIFGKSITIVVGMISSNQRHSQHRGNGIPVALSFRCEKRNKMTHYAELCLLCSLAETWSIKAPTCFGVVRPSEQAVCFRFAVIRSSSPVCGP
jgi:hypothetical protein